MTKERKDSFYASCTVRSRGYFAFSLCSFDYFVMFIFRRLKRGEMKVIERLAEILNHSHMEELDTERT